MKKSLGLIFMTFIAVLGWNTMDIIADKVTDKVRENLMEELEGIAESVVEQSEFIDEIKMAVMDSVTCVAEKLDEHMNED